jgi:hypothetical protein
VTARYAAGTDVSASRSKDEIERTLRRYGATGFMSGWDGQRAIVGFIIHDRQVRFVLPMPDPESAEFTRTETGKSRTAAAAADAYERAVRQVWRVFALVVKAKLEAVAAGLVAFQDEFLAHLVLPGGQTVADTIRSGVDEAYATGQVPALLPDYRRAIEASQ